MIFYDKRNGMIDAEVPDIDYAYHYPQDLKDNLVGLELDDYPDDIFKYRIVDGVLTKMLDIEISELKSYGRILNDDERLENEILDKLKPSYEEINKAEDTIKLLSLLQEVLE